jgi:hypothetical protein
LVEWPIVLGIGGTALVIRQLNQRSDAQTKPSLGAVPVASSQSASAAKRTSARKTTPAKASARKATKPAKSPARKTAARGRRSPAKR